MINAKENVFKKWKVEPASKKRIEEIERLKKEDPFSFSHGVIEFLYNRGCRSAKDIESYVEKGAEMERNPETMKDMMKAVKHIIRAVKEQKHIVVFGDYDVDGIASTTIAMKCLQKLGAKHVDYHINNRFQEGYGISPEGVDSLLKKFPKTDFILTVDNGIVAFEGVKYAVDKGIEVLVTDHHIAKEEIPKEALAVVNPHRLDDSTMFEDICGAAVIYKVMLTTFLEVGLPLDFVFNMKDLVGMATVGDVMPLVDENRHFVHEALKMIERETRPQFQVLRRKKNFKLDEEAFGFTIVPILNACGRLEGTPTKAMAFFLTDNEQEMEVLADELIAINEQRKDITRIQEETAMKMVENEGVSTVLVVAGEGFHEGIVGLIAGRLKEKFYRPTIVLSKEGDYYKGSARSIEAFHMKNAMDKISDLIHKYGGHKLAAGLTIHKDNLEAFKTAINKIADYSLTEEDLTPFVIADSVVTPSDCTREMVEEFDRLRPFGQGFEAPILGLRNFEVDRYYAMGKDKSHLKLVDKETEMNLIMWSGVPLYEELNEPTFVKAMGVPKLNVFRDKVTVQFMVKENNLR